MPSAKLVLAPICALLMLICQTVAAVPSATISTPKHNAITGSSFAIAGTVSGAANRVELKIRDNAGQFWNGSEFQSGWIRLDIAVSGNSWSYYFDNPGLNDSLVISAVAFDADGNRQTRAAFASVTTDSLPPDAQFTAPARNSTHYQPVNIELRATDQHPVERTTLVIRNDSGEYWNGSGFQQAWASVATQKSAGSWHYTLDAGYTGDVSVRARAFDLAGNRQPVAAYLPLTLIDDDQPPVATIEYPARGSSTRMPLALRGTATDNRALHRVDLIIKNSAGEYWNGNRFQTSWYAVAAEVTGGTWRYTDTTLPTPLELDVRARAFDRAGNKQSSAAYTRFELLPEDTQAPASQISYPPPNSTVQLPLTVAISASDDSAVDNVSMVIRDLHTRQYWNGSDFQASWTEVDAHLENDKWRYELADTGDRQLLVKTRARDTAGNVESPIDGIVFETLDCSHRVVGTATPANSGTPVIIDVESISYESGTVISANFFNSGAIIDRNGRSVSVCVSDSDDEGGRRAQIVTDVGQTDNTLIKAYPEFIIGSKFGLTGETSFRPYPALVSSTGFTYPDLQTIAGLVGLPAFTDNLPDIDITIDVDEQNVLGVERDVMLESWFYDTSANASAIGNDAAGNALANTLNNIVGDGHPNKEWSNLALEMMVHIGALSPNDASRATRNPAKHKLTVSPIRIGHYYYHIWYGTTGLSPLVVYSRETNRHGEYRMDLTTEGAIRIDWNEFLDYTLNDLEAKLAIAGVSWAQGTGNVFPVLRTSGAIGAVEFGVEPQTNNADDEPYIATINQLDIRIDGRQFGFY